MTYKPKLWWILRRNDWETMTEELIIIEDSEEALDAMIETSVYPIDYEYVAGPFEGYQNAKHRKAVLIRKLAEQ